MIKHSCISCFINGKFFFAVTLLPTLVLMNCSGPEINGHIKWDAVKVLVVIVAKVFIFKKRQSTSVMATGANKVKQLMSLRNKIKRHKESVSHMQAEKIMQSARKQTIEKNVSKMNEMHFASTNKLFRLAYRIGKLGRPFSDMPTECDVSILNGVDIDTTLRF